MALLDTPGRTFASEGKWFRAWLYFRRQLKSPEPMHRANARLELGLLHKERGSASWVLRSFHRYRSRENLQRATTAEYETRVLPQAHSEYATILQEQGLVPEALDQLKIAIKKNLVFELPPEHIAFLYLRRGTVLTEIGEFERARQDFESGLEFVPPENEPTSEFARRNEVLLRSMLAASLLFDRKPGAAREHLEAFTRRMDLQVAAPEIAGVSTNLYWHAANLEELSEDYGDLPTISSLIRRIYRDLNDCRDRPCMQRIRAKLFKLKQARELKLEVRTIAERLAAHSEDSLKSLEASTAEFEALSEGGKDNLLKMAETIGALEEPSELLPEDMRDRQRRFHKVMKRMTEKIRQQTEQMAATRRMIAAVNATVIRANIEYFRNLAERGYRVPFDLRLSWLGLESIHFAGWLLGPVALFGAVIPWAMGRVFPGLWAALLVALALAVLTIPMARWLDRRLLPHYRKNLTLLLRSFTGWIWSHYNGAVQAEALLKQNVEVPDKHG